MTDVIVVGAGAAGQAAAQELQRQGVSFQVLEATAARGGRARTDTATLGYPVDLGCHWLHSPGHNPFTARAREFGIRVKAEKQDCLIPRGGKFLSAAETEELVAFSAHCFARLKQAGALGRDLSVADFLDCRDDPAWRFFVGSFLAKQACDLDQASAVDFSNYIWEGDDWPVVDGLGALVDRCGADVPVTLDTPVRHIGLTRSGVRVATKEESLEVAAVIVTASTGVLADRKIVIDDLPAETWQAIEALPLGSSNKVALRFDRDVFGVSESTIVQPDLACDDQVEFVLRPGGHNGAVALISGEFSRDLGKLGHGAMVDFTVARLIEIFGSDVEKALLPGRVVINWNAEEWIRGSWSTARVGFADARRQLGLPVEERIFFAGEAVSARYAGDVHGAHLTGIAAAREVAKRLRS